jgi:protein phosphatase
LNKQRIPNPAAGIPELPQPFSSRIDVDVFGISDQGRIRPNNEDHFLVIRCGRILETVFSNLTGNGPGDRFEESGYGFVVADGVGGEAAGEIASLEAIFGLLDLALQTPDWQFKWGAKEMNTVKWRMQDRFRRVNAALVQRGTAHEALRGMCTTMTAALSNGKNLIVGHIGDSRAYLLHQGKLKRLTRDHTLAEQLRGEGIDPLHDRLLNQLKSVLMQALGASESECSPEVDDYVLHDGDQLLLCTDGLTDMLEDTEIESVLLKEESSQSACRKLLDQALANGGRDNVTIIVARYAIPKS